MVVEATVPNSQEECHEAWEPILLAADYQFVYFDGLSRFYVAKEHGDLASSFRAPPNYFDGFVRADLVTAIAERDENARQCSEVRQRLEEATAQFDAARQRFGEMSRLEAENLQLTAQRDAMLNSTSWRLTAPLRGLKRIIFRS